MRPPKLTKKAVREYLRILGATLRYNQSSLHYRLQFRDSPGPDGIVEYFSPDLADVIATARVMLGGHQRFDEAEEYLSVETGGWRAA